MKKKRSAPAAAAPAKTSMADGAGAPEERDLSYFQRWNVESLKDFLVKRAISVKGRKEELAAKCYAAHELKIPIVPSSENIITAKATEYTSRLTTAGINSRV